MPIFGHSSLIITVKQILASGNYSAIGTATVNSDIAITFFMLS